jgi:ATP-dependent DNA ligase
MVACAAAARALQAVTCDDQCTPDFNLLIRKRLSGPAQLYAFDLLELDGTTFGSSQSRTAKRCT